MSSCRSNPGDVSLDTIRPEPCPLGRVSVSGFGAGFSLDSSRDDESLSSLDDSSGLLAAPADGSAFPAPVLRNIDSRPCPVLGRVFDGGNFSDAPDSSSEEDNE
jgi:hypothetical protein